MKKAVKKYKYKIIFVIAAALMIAVIFALFSVDGAANQKNIDFINSFGWSVKDAPSDISHITVPENLSDIYLIHSQISGIEGSSITDFRGKSITRYSYTVLNHQNSESSKIRADVFVYKTDIIAADIADISPGGRISPISDLSEMTPD